jgi:hypothetical protein
MGRTLKAFGIALFFSAVLDAQFSTIPAASAGSGGSGGGSQILPTLTPPVDSEFSWGNQGSSTTTQLTLSSGVTMRPQADNQWHCRIKTAPATPYTVTILIEGFWPRDNGAYSGGLVLREEGTNENLFWMLDMSSNSRRTIGENYTGYTSGGYSGTTINAGGDFTPYRWIRFTDDGTNKSYQMSQDGEVWTTYLTHARTTYNTVDRIGWCAQNAPMTLRHWKIN